jgi:hypothetical protein
MGGDMRGSGQMGGGVTGDELTNGGGFVGHGMSVTERKE